MFQQVNLYQPIFKEEQKLFSATTIGSGLGMIAAGLVLIALYSWWQIAGLNRELRAIQAQGQVHAQLVAASNALFENGESEKALTARINSLAIELDRRQQALRYLGSGDAAAGAGFATRMEALAREQLEGLWLKGAVFTAESGRFALTGSALNAELVPLYLARLAHEPSLAGAKLDSLEIRQPKDEKGAVKSMQQAHVDFVVSSSANAPGKQPRLAMGGAAGNTL
ncbi:MAG: hypothetical protein ABSF94_04620 [Steroidobacteraceae bacterium]|jgi:hypothetical protein